MYLCRHQVSFFWKDCNLFDDLETFLVLVFFVDQYFFNHKMIFLLHFDLKRYFIPTETYALVLLLADGNKRHWLSSVPMAM